MVVFSNYFFDTTQGHSQINGATVRNVYTKEAFDTSVNADFKGDFDLEKLEQGIQEVGAENVPYIVCTITCNSAGGQPVSLANMRAMYEIAKNMIFQSSWILPVLQKMPISSNNVNLAIKSGRSNKSLMKAINMLML